MRVQASQIEERLRSESQIATETTARSAARIETLEASNRDPQERADHGAETEGLLRTQLRAAEADVARFKTESETLRGVLDRLSPPSAPAPVRPSKTARKS